MSLAKESPPQSPPRHYSLLAALLSYLIPGLGQIYQGRLSKGILFFVCLYGLFFLGMYLGSWSNVYLLDEGRRLGADGRIITDLPRIVLIRYPAHDPEKRHWSELTGPLAGVGHRPQFAGQFWIGVAAWPAIWQYLRHDEQQNGLPLIGTFQRAQRDEHLNELQKNGSKIWDLAWVYTVVAGVLNILVIYDAFAGPAVGSDAHPEGGLA